MAQYSTRRFHSHSTHCAPGAKGSTDKTMMEISCDERIGSDQILFVHDLGDKSLCFSLFGR